MENAARWYKRASDSPDGRASMKATEQLANVLGRGAWEKVEDAVRYRDRMQARLDALPASTARGQRSASRGQRTAARRARDEAETRLRTAIASGNKAIDEAHALLEKLKNLKPTVERLNLVGSAHKRQALIDMAAGRPEGAVGRVLEKMTKAYAQGLELSKDEPGADIVYSAMNVVASDVVLMRGGRPRLNRKALAAAEAALEKKEKDGANFWTVVARIELDQLQALAARKLAPRKSGLLARYKKLVRRARSPRQWTSLYDSAFLSLGRYQTARVGDAEKAAAADLLEELHAIAHPERPQAERPQPAAPAPRRTRRAPARAAAKKPRAAAQGARKRTRTRQG
jgi:hypothetical protein